MEPSNVSLYHNTIVLSRDRPQGHKTRLDAAVFANAYRQDRVNSTVSRIIGKPKARGYWNLSRETSMGLNSPPPVLEKELEFYVVICS